MSRIEVVKGDITKQDVHAIVNAAHEGLCGGGGVDGAIHKAAGPTMTGECMNIPFNEQGERCPVGCCRITQGYNLPALYIIHTVGPVWRGGNHNEAADLASCYTGCLKLANLQGLHSIAFPCISTGAYGFPKPAAPEIAFKNVKKYLCYDRPLIERPQNISLVRFVCFDDENYNEYMHILPDGYTTMGRTFVESITER